MKEYEAISDEDEVLHKKIKNLVQTKSIVSNREKTPDVMHELKDDIVKKNISLSDEIDVHEKVSQLIKMKDSKDKNRRFHSAEAQRVFNNLEFADTVENDPITSKDFDRKVLGFETVNINPYINQRIWPHSIYVTDKLIRLAMSAKLEFLKRYLDKKRKVPMSMIWLLVLLFGVVVVVLVIIFLLPQIGKVI